MSHKRRHNDVVIAPNNGLNSIVSLLVLCNLLNKDDCGLDNNCLLILLLLGNNGRGIF